MTEITLDDRGRALENEYFRQKEQELMEKMKAKLDSDSSTETAIQCPKCDGVLFETDHENIKIDVCNKCHGVWLDAGELAQLTQKDSGGWLGKIFG